MHDSERSMSEGAVNKLILIITCEKRDTLAQQHHAVDMLFTLLSSYNYVSLPFSIKHFAVRIYLPICVCICVCICVPG